MDKIRYSKDHIWLLEEEGHIYIGLSEYAKNELGNIVFVNLPDEGEKLDMGNSFGDVESVKTVAELISPIDGTVIKVNEEIVDDPELLTGKTMESWLLEVTVEKLTDELMDEMQYVAWVNEKK